MDRTLAEVDPAPPIDTFAEWRALLAVEDGGISRIDGGLNAGPRARVDSPVSRE